MRTTPTGSPQDDAIALYDTLGPEDRAAVADALAADPALATAFQQWRALRADLGRTLPDGDLLVLHALSDRDGVLSDAERRRLDASRDELAHALGRHPGLAAAVRRIHDDREAFERAWDEGLVAAVPASAEPLARPPVDRAPVDRAPVSLLAARPPAARHPMRWAWRGTALVAVVAFATLATWLLQRDAGFDVVVADAAQTVTLPDGSVADLAAGSVLWVPTADRDARQARLKTGEALFQIVPDADAPFRLETANADVVVLGTTFGVAASEVQTKVALVAGSVSLAPRRQPGAAVRLRPGQSSTVLAADAPSAPEDTDAPVWTGPEPASGPAGAIAERIGQRFGVEVSVADELAVEPVQGRFGAEATAEDALRVLALALGADLGGSDGSYRLTPDR